MICVNHFCLHLVRLLFNYLCFTIWQSRKSLFISKAHRGFFFLFFFSFFFFSFFFILSRFEFCLEFSKFSVSSTNLFFNF